MGSYVARWEDGLLNSGCRVIHDISILLERGSNEMILWTHCFLYGIMRCCMYVYIYEWDTLPSLTIKQRDYTFQLSDVN